MFKNKFSCEKIIVRKLHFFILNSVKNSHLKFYCTFAANITKLSYSSGEQTLLQNLSRFGSLLSGFLLQICGTTLEKHIGQKPLNESGGSSNWSTGSQRSQSSLHSFFIFSAIIWQFLYAFSIAGVPPCFWT